MTAALFVFEAGLDDEAAELDLAPGIAPAFGVSDAAHPQQVAPGHCPDAVQQPCG